MSTDQLSRQLTIAFSDRQIFLVGGSLRDRLLGRPSKDLDLTTDVIPEEIRRRVSPWAEAVWLVGEKYGTVGIMKDGVKAEITTFRADTYDGASRKPQVTFGDDVMADLERRDFTINAIARNLHTGELLDPFGGRTDLAGRLVRFVGAPEERIAEDPLRMLRAVRFCAQLGFELEPVTAVAIAKRPQELARISWERMRDEMDGILLAEHPVEGLRLLIDLGLAERVLPELLRLHLPQPARHHVKDVLDHTLDAVAFVPEDKALRYAALLHDIAKPDTFSTDDSGIHFYRHEELGAERAREILTRLRQPAALVEQVALLVRHHLRIPFYSPEWSLAAVRRLMFEVGGQMENAIALAEADVRASDPSDYPEFQQRLAELRSRIAEVGEAAALAAMKPLLSGNEVMSLLSLPPGPKVGEVLQFLLDRQIEGNINTREEAREAVRREFGAG
jgi:poly(A) polymerase